MRLTIVGWEAAKKVSQIPKTIRRLGNLVAADAGSPDVNGILPIGKIVEHERKTLMQAIGAPLETLHKIDSKFDEELVLQQREDVIHLVFV